MPKNRPGSTGKACPRRTRVLPERACSLLWREPAVHLGSFKRTEISVIKKTLAHPKANDELRKRFREKIAAYEQAGRPIAYLDESGFSQQMPRTHGYSLIGERCLGTHDWHAKGRINVIGAIVGFTFFNRFINMIEAMRSNGCIVEFLPPYSPDLNPIEHKWAQAKAY